MNALRLLQVLHCADREDDWLAIRRAAALGFFQAPGNRLHAKFAGIDAGLRAHDRACTVPTASRSASPWW